MKPARGLLRFGAVIFYLCLLACSGLEAGDTSGASSDEDLVVTAVLTGTEPNGYFGHSVASVGDLNGDGLSEILIGAVNESGTAGAQSGKAYLYNGSDLSHLHTFQGENGSGFGWTVAPLEDINGDSIPDFMISAPNFNSLTGRMYVYSGQDYSELFRITGTGLSDQFGLCIASAGDYDNDGTPDIFVTAGGEDDVGKPNSGRIHVYSGDDQTELFSLFGAQMFEGMAYCYNDIAMGDLNGDGRTDLVVPSKRYDGSAGSDTGRVFAVASGTGTVLWTVEGAVADIHFGSSIARYGDFNNDLVDDIVTGAQFFSGSAGITTGKIFVLSGIDGSELFALEGDTAGERMGNEFAVLDYDGDGTMEIAVGARGYANDRGRVKIISKNGTILATFAGEQAGDHFGYQLYNLGDLNGDSRDELGVTAYGFNGVRGKFYVLSKR